MASMEELHLLEVQLNQLKLDYEQYFLGTRPREPEILRREIQRTVARISSKPIKNTAERFKFNSVTSRFQAYKTRWDTTLRQIEAGTYKRHRFKADLHERDRAAQESRTAEAATESAKQQLKGGAKAGKSGGGDALFSAYMKAAGSCGQDVKNLTPERLKKVVRKQAAELKKKTGCQKVNFKVVVQDGKVRLKASASG